MKKLFPYKTFVYEGVRDQMTPKSKDNIKKYTDKLGSQEKLFRGCKEGFKWLVDEAIEEGQDVHVLDDSAFRIACKYGNSEIVDMLIKMGANVNAVMGMALKNAVEIGNIDVIKLLMKAGADLHLKGTEKLLLLTKNYKNKDIYNLLIKYDKTNESIRDKMTPKSEEDIVKEVGKMNSNDLLLQASRGGSLPLVKKALRYAKKDEYALVNASINGHTEIVEYLIDEKGYDVHYQGELPLRYAIISNRFETVKSLLDRGADIHFHNENPLNTAISYSHWDIANYLIKQGADIGRLHSYLKSGEFEISQQDVVNFMHNHLIINESIRDKMTPRSKKEIEESFGDLVPNAKLVKASEHGVTWMVQEALDEGADVHHINDYALLAACDGNHLDIVKILLDNDADVHSGKDRFLLSAAWSVNHELIKLLLEYGADVNVNGDAVLGSVVEAVAIKKDRGIKTIKLLLEYGAIPRKRDIEFAKAWNRMDIVELLGKYMTNESIRDKMTPKSEEDIMKKIGGSRLSPQEKLEAGVEHGIIWLVKYALENGADVHYDYDRALKGASAKGHTEIVKLLIDAGANVHTDYDNPLIFASQRGYIEIVKMLLDAGADPHTLGNRARMLAGSNGHREVTRLLNQAMNK